MGEVKKAVKRHKHKAKMNRLLRSANKIRAAKGRSRLKGWGVDDVPKVGRKKEKMIEENQNEKTNQTKIKEIVR